MTTSIEDFDYHRIEIEGGPSQLAHCWKHLALVRFERLFSVPKYPGAADLVLKAYKRTELWCGFTQKLAPCYDFIASTPAWPSIDKGIQGLTLIDQFFPQLPSMTDADWPPEGTNRKRIIGILKHTDAIPVLTCIEVLYERKFGKTITGKPLTIPRNPYKGRS